MRSWRCQPAFRPTSPSPFSPPRWRWRSASWREESGVVNGNDPGAESAAELFDLLWGTLADVLGTAATATLLRRAIKQSAARTAWSEPAVVARDGLDYTYRLPEAWKQPGNDEAVDVFRIVAAQLKLLLLGFTGPRGA